MKETDYLNASPKLIGDAQKLPALSAFSYDDLKLFLKMSKIRRYSENEVICREGHVDNWLYFLIQGKVQVEKNGKEIAVLEKRGEMFGEMGLIDGSPRSASIKAISPAACLAKDTDLLDRLEGTEKVAFGYVLFRALAVAMAARLKAANDLVVNMPDKFNWASLTKRFF